MWGDCLVTGPVSLSEQPQSIEAMKMHTNLEKTAHDKAGKILDTGSCSVEVVSLGQRCTVRTIHDVISRFDAKKRELVDSIEFGGLLDFPYIKSTNKRFSSWLMGMVDVGKGTLKFIDGSIIPFSKKDIATVFGVPADGKKIKAAHHLSKQDKELMKTRCWPLSGKENHSIRAVQELIETIYPYGMTTDQEDAFKVAFVVFVMSILFVPGAKHDYVCVDYWPALMDPNNIQSFDWADYILNRLIASASKFQEDSLSGCRNASITGCYLFLQVFYLDNIELGKLNTDQQVLPRISCFNDKQLRLMITADTQTEQSSSNGPRYGKSQIRHKVGSCYTWAREETIKNCEVERDIQISVWQASVRMAKILRLPLEAAGPLFIAAEELGRRKPTATHYGIDCINVLLSIMQPYVEGFRYKFGLHSSNSVNMDVPCTVNPGEDIDSWQVDTAGIHKQRSHICICNKRKNEEIYSLTDKPEYGNINEGCTSSTSCSRYENSKRQFCGQSSGIKYAVIESMSQFYMLVHLVKAHKRIDLNTGPVDNNDVHTIKDAIVAGGARSPWEIGGMWDYHELAGIQLEAGSSLDIHSGYMEGTAVTRMVDYCPKYIEVMPDAAREQQLGLSEMEMDMFDALMRSFRVNDDIVYRSEGRVRWRHFFESDILTAVIARCFNIDNPSIRNQFIGSHLKYDIWNCSMLFFPVILQYRWVCFSWNLVDNIIVVFDPECMNMLDTITQSMYNHVTGLLKSMLSSTIPTLFRGWEHNWNAARVTPFEWRNADLHRKWNCTGVLCAYFCRCFDGERLLPDIEKGDIDQVAAMLFGEVSGIHGAYGTI